MKILTIESNDSGDGMPEQFRDWPDELRDAYDEADVVIFTFAPFAHTILKGPTDLVVTDVRARFRGHNKWEFYEAQRDVAAAREEAHRVRNQGKTDETAGKSED